ncbi:MAG: thioredoxin TrxA [Moraxellaceae bacterium]|nr:thioredoxin TrxA [Pseudomonadales bacterium]MCB1673888.1 thioredoxin TrxA [Pseudomonadales bacterium]MCP5173783.1 thioredoxin TrxA [Moraxellaceae bacterium]MCP5176898.1 thioredoxin TrxA [Moraxellaceae bacterium]HQV21487.1 thioredoxin TrxA [Agitococcus sp.]
MASPLIVNTTDAQFEEEVLNADSLVLVDYWAPWCGPCKMIAPILDDLAGEYQGKVKIVKVNVDENPATAQKFGVKGIPTLSLFKGGQVVATKVGALAKSQLTAFLDSNI